LTRVFGLLGTTIAVAADEPSILDWLDEFLTPGFARLPAAAPADFRVTIHAQPEASARVAATRPPGALPDRACFALDQEIVAHPHWTAADGIVVDDRRLGAYYVLRGNTVEVAVHPDARRPRSGAMRVVRELAIARALADRRHLQLHASALATGDGSVLFVGPKGCGKTTVLACLVPGGGRIIANDRVLVSADGGPPVAHGIPTIVSLRAGTIALLAPGSVAPFRRVPDPAGRTLTELAAAGRATSTAHRPASGDTAPVSAHQDDAEPLRLSLAGLAHVLGVELAGHAPLSAIAFPERPGDERTVGVRRLSPAEARKRLLDARFGLANDASRATAFDELVGRTADVDETQRARLAELAARVPCFAVSIGTAIRARPDAAADVVRQLTCARQA
jgi:hypothetical protein